MKICPICGNEVEDSVTICPSCGSEFQVESKPEPEKKKEKKPEEIKPKEIRPKEPKSEDTKPGETGGNNKKKTSILPIIILIIVAAVAFILIRDRSGSSSSSSHSGSAAGTYTITFTADEGGKIYQGDDKNDTSTVIKQEVSSADDIEAVTAVPDDGYTFNQWQDTNGNRQTDGQVFTADTDEDAEYTATFTKIVEDAPVAAEAYTLTFTSGSGGKVAFSSDEEGTSTKLTQKVYSVDDIEEMVAVPDDGYSFVNWTDADGNEVATDAAFMASSEEAATYTANFKEAVFEDWHDDTLKNKIAQALGKDASEITKKDLESIDKLYIIGDNNATMDEWGGIGDMCQACKNGSVGSCTIKDLEDLKNLTNLQILYLQFSNLTNDTLATLQLPGKVYMLNLDYNKLTSLDALASCSSLTTLSARDNSITDYSVLNNLPNISQTDFTNNPKKP